MTGTITVKAVSASTVIDVLKQQANNTWTKAQLTMGQTYSTGSPATVDPDNTDAVHVDVVQFDRWAEGCTNFDLGPAGLMATMNPLALLHSIGPRVGCAGGAMLASFSYVLLQWLLELIALRVRSTELKELEIVVLRHELAILRRKT